jgi:hypothetical protein
MAELSGLAKSLGSTLLPLLRSGILSFAQVFFLGNVTTVFAMGLAGYFSSKSHLWTPMILSSIVVGLLGLITTVILASHRAVFSVAKKALVSANIGTTLFGFVFERLLRVSDESTHGDRLGTVGATFETRIPLAQAQQRLTKVVSTLTRESHAQTGMSGWLFGKVRSLLLEQVEFFTLARFRKDHQRSGAIDLLQIRDELGQGLDALLVEQIDAANTRFTLILTGLASLAAALLTYLFRIYF